MHTNAKGFGHIEMLLTVLVVLVLGFGGWYIWDANQSDDTDTAQSTETASTAAETEAVSDDNATEDAVPVENPAPEDASDSDLFKLSEYTFAVGNKTVSFTYPEEWTQLEQSEALLGDDRNITSFTTPSRERSVKAFIDSGVDKCCAYSEEFTITLWENDSLESENLGYFGTGIFEAQATLRDYLELSTSKRFQDVYTVNGIDLHEISRQSHGDYYAFLFETGVDGQVIEFSFPAYSNRNSMTSDLWNMINSIELSS